MKVHAKAITNAGTLTKIKTYADHSNTVDAKATKTNSVAKKLVNTNAKSLLDNKVKKMIHFRKYYYKQSKFNQ